MAPRTETDCEFFGFMTPAAGVLHLIATSTGYKLISLMDRLHRVLEANSGTVKMKGRVPRPSVMGKWEKPIANRCFKHSRGFASWIGCVGPT